MTKARWTALVVGVALVAVTATVWLWRSRPEDRLYRIGWEHDPPVQVATPGGEPSGVWVEVVREAARRRGIRLQWVHRPEGSQAALRSKAVDLWPLMTITSERKKVLHLTDPFQENEFLFMIVGEGPVRTAADLAHATISLERSAIAARFLKKRFPGARLLEKKTDREAVDCLCRGESQVVFVEEHLALMILFERAACPERGLRMLPLSALRTRLGMGATFEARNAADAIRDEMTAMYKDGTLARILSAWSYYSAHEVESLEALLNAAERERRYRLGLAALALLLTSMTLLAVGFRRERNKARATDRALRRAERNLRLVADSLSEMVLAYDMDRKLTYANPTVERLTGYTPAELKARGFICWIHPEDQSRMLAHWDRLFQGHSFQQEEYRLISKDGQEKWASATWGPIFDEEGRQVGVQGSERDVTERKRLEEQLAQAQKMEAVGRLSGGIAHDFNNLLTVISGYSELLLAKLDPQDPLASSVAEIRRAGEKAAGLTQQLLAFSRKQFMQPKVVDLNSVVSDAEKMLRRVIGENIELIAHLEPRLGTVRADPDQIGQVLVNLAVNARDAMPGGGKLILETANREFDEEHVRSHPEAPPGRYVMLAVSDTGAGMDEETKARIFEPFFTTKERGKGTGLGLSTVYGIVAQSEGHVWVHSEPGKGTTFRVYLPRLDQVPEETVAPAPDGDARGSETVLLVEDQTEVRELAAGVLSGYGYQVLEAASGEQAEQIAELAELPVDAVVTDVVLPGISGSVLAERLKARWPGLRVLYMSGYSDDVVVHHGALDAEVAFLQKPFSPEALARKLRELLD